MAQEIKQQKTQLIKQREEYVRKIKVLRRELEVLRKQEREFLSEKSPERDTEHILIENNKLQVNIAHAKRTVFLFFVTYFQTKEVGVASILVVGYFAVCHGDAAPYAFTLL